MDGEPEVSSPKPVAAEPERSPCYRAVLDLLSQTVTGLEQLVEDSGHPSAQVLVALTELEVDGRARRTAGGYCRC